MQSVVSIKEIFPTCRLPPPFEPQGILLWLWFGAPEKSGGNGDTASGRCEQNSPGFFFVRSAPWCLFWWRCYDCFSISSFSAFSGEKTWMKFNEWWVLGESSNKNGGKSYKCISLYLSYHVSVAVYVIILHTRKGGASHKSYFAIRNIRIPTMLFIGHKNQVWDESTGWCNFATIYLV